MIVEMCTGIAAGITTYVDLQAVCACCVLACIVVCVVVHVCCCACVLLCMCVVHVCVVFSVSCMCVCCACVLLCSVHCVYVLLCSVCCACVCRVQCVVHVCVLCCVFACACVQVHTDPTHTSGWLLGLKDSVWLVWGREELEASGCTEFLFGRCGRGIPTCGLDPVCSSNMELSTWSLLRGGVWESTTLSCETRPSSPCETSEGGRGREGKRGRGREGGGEREGERGRGREGGGEREGERGRGREGGREREGE